MSDAPAASPMNLALVVEQFGSSHAGPAGTGERIAWELLARGHRVHVFAGFAEDRPPREGLTVQQCGGKRAALRLLRLSSWSRAEIARGGFDASLSLTSLCAAGVVAPRGGTVAEYHRRIGEASRASLWRLALSPRERVKRHLEQRTMRDPLVRRYVVHSRCVEQQLLDHYRVSQDRIVLNPGGFDLPVLDEAERRKWRELFRRRLRIESAAPVFLFLSEDLTRDGAAVLLRAMGRVRESRPDAVLLVAGQLPYFMQRDAAAQGLRAAVRMVGTCPDPAPLFAAADVLVHPTPAQAASASVLSAMSCGLPVVASRFDGASEWINAELPGRIIAQPDDPVQLAEAMLDAAGLSREAGDGAARVSLRDALCVRRHVEVLERVLRETSSGGGA